MVVRYTKFSKMLFWSALHITFPASSERVNIDCIGAITGDNSNRTLVIMPELASVEKHFTLYRLLESVTMGSKLTLYFMFLKLPGLDSKCQ